MKSRLFHRTLTGIAAVIGILAAGAAWATPVTVVAHFNDGNTAEAVDGYVGMAGDGWTGPWEQAKLESTTITAGVVTAGDPGYSPLQGGGNYLSTTLVGTAVDDRGSVGRTYTPAIDLTADHTITFKYRIDEDLSQTFTSAAYDRYSIFDYEGMRAGTSSACRWQVDGISGDGLYLDTWKTYNGSTVIDTGIQLAQGLVYDFEIKIHAATKQWDLRISDGMNVFNSANSYIGGMSWRNTDGATVLGTVNFNARVSDEFDSRTFSVDALSITGTAPSAPVPWTGTTAAHFTAGNTNLEVDGFVGKAGAGWASPWGVGGVDTVYTATVVSSEDAGFSELKPGMGSYLKMTVTADVRQADSRAAIARDYKAEGAIDATAPHKIEFTLRIDEDFAEGSFTAFNDRYSIYDRASVYEGTGNTDRWGIYGMANVDATSAYHAFAGKWVFYNNPLPTGTTWDQTALVDTGIYLATDHVYDFTIVVNPDSETYDATLVDVTADLSFSATNLHWRRRGQGVGGFIHFQGYDVYATPGDRAFSLDGLVITQVEFAPVPGDTNNDGMVDDEDAKRLALNWGATTQTLGLTWWEMGDFNGDGKIDARDAAILAAHWGDHRGGESASVAVPEPSAIVLLLGAAAILLAKRRRR